MSTITTKDGTEIFYKDWGKGQPIVFHHGWPLSGDDWDNQMLFFLDKGYRVIAHDRRGHGRSSQTDTGNEMDTYAADLAELAAALDLRDAIHVGHSTGGGEVARYVARHGKGRVAKAVLIGAVPPVMVKSDKNPGGLPIDVFDGLRAALAANRAQFYIDFPSGPFYGFNRPGAKVSQGLIQNWWRQGMIGGAKAHYDCIKAFSETDFTEDLKQIDVPVFFMHGTDDQIVPIAELRSAGGQARQERNAEDVRGPAARHVRDASGHRQSRPARLHPRLTRPRPPHIGHIARGQPDPLWPVRERSRKANRRRREIALTSVHDDGSVVLGAGPLELRMTRVEVTRTRRGTSGSPRIWMRSSRRRTHVAPIS